MQLPHSDKLVTRSQGPLPVSENGRASEPEESDGQQKTAESLVGRHEAKIHAQKAKIHVLRTSKEKYARKYEAAKKRIAGLEDTVRKASRIHQQNLERQDKHIQAIEDELALAQDLLSARTKELSGAQSFLSTTDRLSEAEVLGIVRDLNENIFQVTTNLAEEWEKLALSLPARLSITPENSLDNFSRFYGSTLIYRSFQWDPTAVTYLIQSCLCYFATEMTSSWRRIRNDGEELKILASVYEHLYAFEGQAISARWRSLTHSHLVEPSSFHSPSSIAYYIAEVLWLTGSFQSLEDTLDFVKANASNRLEIIYQLASRLESAFMVDVTSCDMYLLCEAPLTMFDDTKMTKEFGSDDSSAQKRDKVAGITGVGVEKSVWGRSDEDLRVEVLLKATVVMEEDFEDS